VTMRWIADLNLGAKLSIASVVLALLPLGGFGLFAFHSAEESLIGNSGRRLEETAFSTIDRLDRNLFERYGNVQAFALSEAAKTMHPEGISRWISRMMASYSPTYDLMVVADAHGRIIAVNSTDADSRPLDATRALLGRDVSEAKWYRDAISGRLKPSDVMVDDVHHDDLMAAVYGTTQGADIAMSFTAAIWGPNDEVVGVWSNRFNWDIASTILEEVESRARKEGQPSVRLAIVSSQGTVLAAPGGSAVLQDTIFDRASLMNSRGTAVGHADGRGLVSNKPALEGWAKSSGYSHYPGMGWTVVATRDYEDVLSDTEKLRLAMLVAFIVAVVVVAFGAALVARSIGSAVGQVSEVAKRLARGQLDQKITINSRDEIGEMAEAFREMIAYLNSMAAAANAVAKGDLTTEVCPQSEQDVLGTAFQRMVGGLRGLTAELQKASLSLSGATNDILTAVSQQSSGATEQSAAITETTATVEEVSASADQAVQMAMVVSQTAQQANRVVSEGVEAVKAATEGMEEMRHRVQSIAENILALSEQSQQIGEITATVSDLADQSNLLALNAAIEASRAGEHGKGFAVVASEIRSLAEQSKAATAQVRTILMDIQRATNAAVMATEQGTKGVDAAVQLIDKTGQTIGELEEVVRGASQSASQIAASVRQHSVGMQQIAAAMGNIEQATNQGLLATTSTKRAAENLTELTGRLNRLVALYRLLGGEQAVSYPEGRATRAGIGMVAEPPVGR